MLPGAGAEAGGKSKTPTCCCAEMPVRLHAANASVSHR